MVRKDIDLNLKKWFYGHACDNHQKIIIVSRLPDEIFLMSYS